MELSESYSQACARAGLIALIFASIGLTTYLRASDYEKIQSALYYAQNRELITTQIEYVEKDKCWPDSELASSALTIFDVYTTACNLSTGQKESIDLNERTKNELSATRFYFDEPTTYADDGRPHPPRNLRL